MADRPRRATRRPDNERQPVNTRSVDDKGVFENRFTLFSLKLPVDVDDPVERFQIIHDATTAAKESVKSSSSNTVENLFEILPLDSLTPVVNGLISGLGAKAPVPFNTLVTNAGSSHAVVPGRRQSSSACTLEMQSRGTSLIIAAMSYAGQMFVTAVGHRENIEI